MNKDHCGSQEGQFVNNSGSSRCSKPGCLFRALLGCSRLLVRRMFGTIGSHSFRCERNDDRRIIWLWGNVVSAGCGLSLIRCFRGEDKVKLCGESAALV